MTLDQIKVELGILREERARPRIDKAIREGLIPAHQRDGAVWLAGENPKMFEKFIGAITPPPGTLTPKETEICANLSVSGVDPAKFLAAKAARAKSE